MSHTWKRNSFLTIYETLQKIYNSTIEFACLKMSLIEEAPLVTLPRDFINRWRIIFTLRPENHSKLNLRTQTCTYQWCLCLPNIRRVVWGAGGWSTENDIWKLMSCFHSLQRWIYPNFNQFIMMICSHSLTINLTSWMFLLKKKTINSECSLPH